MPALKNKTNLINVDRRESSEPSLALQKKKPYSRKTEVLKDDVATNGVVVKAVGSRAQGGAKKDIKIATGRNANQSGTAKRQLEVEVIINRSVRTAHQDSEDKDELASDSDIDEQSGGTLNVERMPSRSVNAALETVPESEEEAGNQVGEAMFWEGGDQESLDDMIDNLLKRDTGNVAMEKGNAVKKATAAATVQGQAAFSKVKGKGSILPTDKKNKASLSGTSNAPVPGMTPPRSATVTAGHPIMDGTRDLAHSIVIKVLEHALRKNIDWFTMSKELEAEGLKNGRPAALGGKGKGKAAKLNGEHVEGADSTTARQNSRVKMDGNALCKFSDRR